MTARTRALHYLTTFLALAALIVSIGCAPHASVQAAGSNAITVDASQVVKSYPAAPAMTGE